MGVCMTVSGQLSTNLAKAMPLAGWARTERDLRRGIMGTFRRARFAARAALTMSAYTPAPATA
jgi:hypothetical protein